MPSFTFTSPEGKSYTVAGPDGATKEQAFQMLQQQLGQTAPTVEPEVPVEQTPEAGPEPDLWQRAKPYVMPVAETLGLMGGALVGGGAGTLAAPGLGTAGGAVAGAGLGYAGVKELERLADQQFSGAAAPSLPQALGGAAKNVAVGGALEAGGQGIAAQLAKWVESLGKERAAKILERVIAEDPATAGELRQALANAPPGLTAAQAGAGVNAPTFQALGETASAARPGASLALSQADEAARLAALQGVTPDQSTAEGLRKMVSDILYGRARTADTARQAASPGVSPQLQALDNDPVVQAAADVVRRIHPNIGNPMESFHGLELMKKAIDAQLKSPNATNALQNYTRSVTLDSRGKLISAIENLGGGVGNLYRQARGAHTRLSAPVNQSKVLSEMTSVLQKPGGGERVGPFLNVMGRGEQALLQRSTGGPRFGNNEIADVLNPTQMGVVNRIENELTRDIGMATQAKAGRNALGQVMGQYGKSLPIPSMFDVKATWVKAALSELRGTLNQKALDKLADAMLSGRDVLPLLNQLDPVARKAALAALRNTNALRMSGTGIASMGTAPVNNALTWGAEDPYGSAQVVPATQ